MTVNNQKFESIKIFGSGLLFAAFVGFSFVGLKQMVQYSSAIQAIGYRYTFAMAALIICLVFRVVKVNYKGKPVLKALPIAGLYFLFMLLQAAGLKYSTSIESGIVFAIIPIFAGVLARFILKEKPTFVQSLFMLLSISALIIMILCGASNLQIHPLGITLLILASFSMALNNVLMRYVRDKFSAMEMTTLIIAEGFIILNIINIVIGLKNGNLGEFFSLITIPKFVISGIYLAIPCTLISTALMTYMIRRVDAVRATIFGNLSTAISVVAGVVIMNEPLHWYHILCSILIIAGVIGISVSGAKFKNGEI